MSEPYLSQEAAVPQAPKSKPLKLPFPRDCPIELDVNPEMFSSASWKVALPGKGVGSAPKNSVLKFLSKRQLLGRGGKE